MSSVREETARGIKWGLIQKCTMQPVQFLFGVILARLITPEEMGILGLTGIFFAFAGQLQECGFGSALIRKQDRTDEDICTVFWFNVAMSFLLSLALFLAAPWFVWFFDQPALLNLTRVSALLMFLNSTGSVHWTLYQARRDFKTPAIISMCTTLIAMPFTIWAAYVGWSYWAVMLQGIISGLLSLSTVWIISPWKPRACFSRQSFHDFFKFGINLTLAGMIGQLYTQSRLFIIGKFYAPAQIALYTRGETLCSTPLNLFQSVMTPVTYPILSTLQNNPGKLSHVYRQYIRLSAIIVQWGMLTIAANSHAAVLFLYGKEWEPCVAYAQILCFGWMFNPLFYINLTLFAVLGRTDASLKFETILRIFSISAMIICAFISVKAICIAAVLSALFAFFGSSTWICRLSGLRITDLLQDFLFYLLFAAIANIPSLFISYMEWSPMTSLATGTISSLLIYLLILYIRKDQTALYIWDIIISKVSAKKTPLH